MIVSDCDRVVPGNAIFIYGFRPCARRLIPDNSHVTLIESFRDSCGLNTVRVWCEYVSEEALSHCGDSQLSSC